ncbi:MAG: ArsA family ATPase, partial [Methanophagales archaeon]|nr:ArsA family ATPase [Methanophagales archaeon]
MRVIFYTGKGGSGKSVISCATALKLSELGYETLVISSDPAHTISDAFEMPVQYTPTKIAGRDKLWAIQVDPIREAREKFGVIQEYIVSLFKSKAIGVERRGRHKFKTIEGKILERDIGEAKINLMDKETYTIVVF